MGRYVPPDLEGRVSFNQASGKGHALGARASKLKSEGILTVRFECPFTIWCTTCQPEQIIAQGVRFNAEKKKVSNYYTTPIWGFRFKHSVCGGWIEIRTDPKNAEYVVTEGARRRDYGGDKLLDGEIKIGGSGLTEEEKDRLEKDAAFAGLEKKVEDKRAGQAQNKRLEELANVSQRDWSDPYERSQLLRREFRVGRRKRQEDERTGEELKERFGIEIELLPGKEEDGKKAKLVDYGIIKKGDSNSKPLFEARTSPAQNEGQRVQVKTSKAASLPAQRKSMLQSTIKGNSRATVDPFLKQETTWQPRAKRKRTESAEIEGKEEPPPVPPAASLVDYDSDFE